MYDESWGYRAGIISQVAIYNYALSPAQVLAHYQASQGTFRRDFTSTRKVYVPSLVEAGSYITTTLSLGPSAYWPLAVAVNGTTPDLSGNNHPGTLSSSGITPNVNGPFQRMGDAAMSFLGSNGYINVPTLVPNGASLSIACWVRLRSFQGCLVAMATSPNLAAEAQTAIYCANGQWISANTNYSLAGGINLFPPNLHEWYQVVFVYEAGVGSDLYANGQGLGMNNTLGNTADDLYVTLGAGNMTNWYDNDGTYLDGDLTHVAIYDYALSAAQVALLWNAGQGQFLDSTIPA